MLIFFNTKKHRSGSFLKKVAKENQFFTHSLAICIDTSETPFVHKVRLCSYVLKKISTNFLSPVENQKLKTGTETETKITNFTNQLNYNYL